jgi:sugar phosphate permease
MDEPEPAAEQPRRWLTPGVGGVGLASFFSDAGHEVATAVLPSFLTSVLHASPGALGIIEGTSDALLGVSKIAGGTLADDPRRRATLATGGYVTTAVATSAIGLAATVWQVGVLRATAWVARGVRTPARDALLASLVPPHAYGRAFGLERAGDNLGTVVGPLMAALLVSLVGVRHAFYWALLPGY